MEGEFLETLDTASLSGSIRHSRVAEERAMTTLDNYRTHYCPDSGFSLISENDIEFEACNCFQSAVRKTVATSVAEVEAEVVRNSPMAAEQIWYRTIAALAKVCGTARPIQVKTPVEQVKTPVHQKHEEALARIRKS
jgi:hypothetical protein